MTKSIPLFLLGEIFYSSTRSPTSDYAHTFHDAGFRPRLLLVTRYNTWPVSHTASTDGDTKNPD